MSDSQGVSSSILTYATDPEVRRKVYTQSHAKRDGPVKNLEELLAKRHQLAKLLGHDSYAQMFLADKVVKTPGMPPRLLSFFQRADCNVLLVGTQKTW